LELSDPSAFTVDPDYYVEAAEIDPEEPPS
jgi:hypothetical protein